MMQEKKKSGDDDAESKERLKPSRCASSADEWWVERVEQSRAELSRVELSNTDLLLASSGQ